MKPSTKPNSASKKRQQTSENDRKSKISKYFKSAEKSFVVEERGDKAKTDNVKDFYIEELKEKLQSFKDVNAAEDELSRELANQENTVDAVFDEDAENDGGPVDKTVINSCGISKGECTDCQKKTAECKEWEEKYKKMKRSFIKLSIDHSDISMKYKDLLNVATGKNKTHDQAEAKTSDDIFTPNELKYLQYMSLGKEKDSTFILQCLHLAYKSDRSVLAQKSLTGTTEKVEITDTGDRIVHAGKDALSPIKVVRIKELFIERLSKCGTDAVDYGERIQDSYVDKLFGAGIKNIAKRKH